MEDYFLAKRRLFEAGPELAVVNVDDPYGARLAARLPARPSASASTRRTRRCARPPSRATRAGRPSRSDGLALRTTLPGRFNVLNALGAVVVARELGVDDAAIARGLAAAERVPGRFEPVDEGQPFAVFVDYSHKPDALEAVLRTARGLTRGPADRRLRRRRRPRPRQAPADGRAAAEHADVAIITSDNPRSEDPEAIMAEIAQGAPGRRARRRSPGGHRARHRAGRAGRRGRRRRQGPRAGPGVRGRPHGALRRRGRRPRGPACATWSPEQVARRPPAGGSSRRARSPAGPRAR